MKNDVDLCWQVCEMICDREERKLLMNMSDDRYNQIESSFGDFLEELEYRLKG